MIIRLYPISFLCRSHIGKSFIDSGTRHGNPYCSIVRSTMSNPTPPTPPEASLPFLSFTPGKDVGDLELWPFTNPASNYVIHEDSSPVASGRIDSSTSTTRVGIWKCTKGKFECTEQGDELMTILSGKAVVTDVNAGQAVELGPGDSMFSRNGKRVIWDILEDVTKVFYGSKVDGF